MPPHRKEQNDFHGAEGHADNGQGHIILQQQQEIEHRHKQIQHRRSRRPGQGNGNGLIETHAAGHLCRITLMKELHRQL